MTSAHDQPHRQFDDLLPFYVTGQLSAEQRAWADEYLARHPESAARLEWHRALGQEVAAQAEARARSVPEMVGWPAVQAGLRELRHASPPSVWSRLGSWLAPMIARPLAPVAALVILVQAGVIGTLLQHPTTVDDEPSRSAVRVPVRDVLQVRFKAGTAERDVRGLLYAAGARIVDGPDQLGDYLIEPRAGSLATLQAELESSEWVQSLRLLKGWKPEPRQE